MDENQNSLTDFKVENLSVIPQLPSGIDQIVIDLSAQCISNKVNTDVNMSLNSSIEDIENQVAMMSFREISLTSRNESSTEESGKNTYCEVSQLDTEVQMVTMENDGFTEQKNEDQNRSYYSYSNLINKYCCKCNVILDNVGDTKCYKCQSLLKFCCKKCSGLYDCFIGVLCHIKYACYKLPTYYCIFCGYSTHHKINFDKHMETKHLLFSELEYPHQCSLCKKKFKKQHYILQHERICKKEPYLICQYCPYKTKLYDVLKQHIHKKHQQHIIYKHKCLDCGRKCNDAKSLLQHKITCRVKKFFKCENCHFKTEKKLALVDHINKIHSSFFEKMPIK